MRQEELLSCQVKSWLPNFHNVTYRTTLIDLPAEFVEYLTEDGVFVSDESAAVCTALSASGQTKQDVRAFLQLSPSLQLPTRVKPPLSLDDEDYQDWSDEDEAEPTRQRRAVRS